MGKNHVFGQKEGPKRVQKGVKRGLRGLFGTKIGINTNDCLLEAYPGAALILDLLRTFAC
jgi:hypothetical protein